MSLRNLRQRVERIRPPKETPPSDPRGGGRPVGDYLAVVAAVEADEPLPDWAGHLEVYREPFARMCRAPRGGNISDGNLS